MRLTPRIYAMVQSAETTAAESVSASNRKAAVAASTADLASHVGEAGNASESQAKKNEKGLLRYLWTPTLRWRPTSVEELVKSEERLLTLIKTPYKLEKVNIGPTPVRANKGWFGTAKPEDRFINTLTISTSLLASTPGERSSAGVEGEAEPTEANEAEKEKPTLVMIHGYGASQGFFFRNFDSLAEHFKVVTLDQLGWGGSSRPKFSAKSPEEAEEWFVGALEEWRKAMGLPRMLLLGHSFGAYVASRYALQHPDRVQHLVLVGPAGFATESERMSQFRATWKGSAINAMWQANMTPMTLIRASGWLGPRVVLGYTSARFGKTSQGLMLSGDEAPLLTDYMYHTLAAEPSGELCLKYVFSLGAFARRPLIIDASKWKVPTTLIYGVSDWMDYGAGRDAARLMPVPAEVLRIPKAGHFAFMDNAPAFHAAVLYACRDFITSTNRTDYSQELPEELVKVPLESTEHDMSSPEYKTVESDEIPTENLAAPTAAFQSAAKKWGLG